MNILVVFAHPSSTSFVGSLRDLVMATASGSKNEVRQHDLYEEAFSSVLSENEWRLHLAAPETKPHLSQYFEDLQWCDTLVFVYPTWWGCQPAIMKSWFDRVLAHDVAWYLPAGAKRIKPKLTNVKRIIAITTHGSGKLTNALEGEPGKRIITRSLRILCSWRCRTIWLAFYGVDNSNRLDRNRFTQRVERRLQRLLHH